MPKMTGYEATEAIRKSANPDAKSIPIIAMTADAFGEDIQKCLASGMNAHIAKPIDPNHLYETLAEYLGSAKPI
jgi:two-component system sensor histidine kinase/response regulator